MSLGITEHTATYKIKNKGLLYGTGVYSISCKNIKWQRI